MLMSSSIRTVIISRNTSGDNYISEISEDESLLHPIMLALIHSSIIGEEIFRDLYEEKNKLSEDEFKNLNVCTEITNCAICMENKKLNIELKCKHVFCKSCIKKWLTEKSNTCPNCRITI